MTSDRSFDNNDGCFIVFDGIAGGGKSTTIGAVAELLQKNGHKVFHLSDWNRASDKPPEYVSLSDCDVFCTFEPTRSGIGAVIRGELSRDDDPYSGEVLAQAFSLDRFVMYRRLIIPALKAGKVVIQDRCVSTSLVYQPAMEGELSIDEVLNMPGNRLAMEHAPDLLLLFDVEVETALKRLQKRDGVSRGVFADPDLLRKWQARYQSDWLERHFTVRGTDVQRVDTSFRHLNTDHSKKRMVDKVVDLIRPHLADTDVRL